MSISKNILSLLLLISIIGNIVLVVVVNIKEGRKSIIGTYCSEHANENLAKYGKYGDYLALADNGTYARYLQQDMLEKGSYRWEESDSSFFLENSAGYFDGKDTLILYHGQEATTYTRILDAPAYIQ